ncbi:MAG: tetratricopeptide repeat protein, partial [bacterium]
MSDANINLGIYDTVLIDKAIDIFKYSSDTEKFARAKSLKGYLLSLKGCFADASEILNEAYVNFKRCDKIRDSAKTLNRLAYCSFKLGNINSAIFHLQKVIEIYINLGDKVNEIKMAHNLAHLFYSIGSLNKSNDIYKNYNSVICKLADKSKINYYYNSAITVASLNNNITAKKTISKAKPFIDKFPREKAIYFENLGLINILSSDYKEAEKALHEGLKISLEIAPKSALISQIKRLFGDLYIATGKYELAEKYT